MKAFKTSEKSRGSISKRRIRLIAVILSLLLALPLAVSCSDKEPMTRTFYEYFDTVTTVSSYAVESEADFEKNCAATEDILSRYHRLLDVYHEYSGINNLKTVNDNAGISPVKVERELIEFLLYAKEIYSLTKGETNIALGSVTALWHTERENAAKRPEEAKTPSADALAAAGEHISIHSVVIDEAASTVYISDPQARIDVGALGKGYATEVIAAALRHRGADSYVLNVGGNIRILGKKTDGSGWITGIKSPKGEAAEPYALKLELCDISCVTSGDYERFYTVGDKNYHHVIDKDTLYPAEYFSSVTVLCGDSALADALSTALFCMSYDEGLSLISGLDGVEVIWIDRDGMIKMTSGVEELVRN